MSGGAAVPPLPDSDCAWFLDVDGTLIDIADTPDAVCVDAVLLDLLAELCRMNGGAVALVSGRTLPDLQRRFGHLGLPMAGSHGVERLDAAGRCHIHAAAPLAKNAIKAKLAPILARHTGLLLEDKGMALALHYRRAQPLAATARRLMRKHAAPGFEVQLGKCVVELKPSGCDKASALARYLEEAPFRGRRPVFIGDDLTDECAFAEVNRRDGISVKVGPGASCARFRLPDVAAVRLWLRNTVEGMPCRQPTLPCSSAP